MTLIDGDRIVTAQLYDDEHEEFVEKKMSIIDYVNAYTSEGVTTADDVLDEIRGELHDEITLLETGQMGNKLVAYGMKQALEIINKYTGVNE